MYIYIYICRERDIDRYRYIIYIYIYVHTYVWPGGRGDRLLPRHARDAPRPEAPERPRGTQVEAETDAFETIESTANVYTCTPIV